MVRDFFSILRQEGVILNPVLSGIHEDAGSVDAVRVHIFGGAGLMMEYELAANKKSVYR